MLQGVNQKLIILQIKILMMLLLMKDRVINGMQWREWNYKPHKSEMLRSPSLGVNTKPLSHALVLCGAFLSPCGIIPCKYWSLSLTSIVAKAWVNLGAPVSWKRSGNTGFEVEFTKTGISQWSAWGLHWRTRFEFLAWGPVRLGWR